MVKDDPNVKLATDILRAAIYAIDCELGPSASKANPALVAGFMQTVAALIAVDRLDDQDSQLLIELREIKSDICDKLGRINSNAATG